MTSLNIPETISADELLAAGLSPREMDAIRDALPEATAQQPVSTDEPTTDSPPAKQVAADAHYDANDIETVSDQGADTDASVAEAPDDKLREYDPALDETPAPPEPPPEAATKPDANNETGGADPELAALLDLRRPEVSAPSRDFAADEAAAKQQMADLQQQYDDGDITADEYKDQRGQIIDTMADIRADQRLAAKAATPDLDAFRDGWYKLVDRHMDANPVLRDDPEVTEGFDTILRQVTADPNLSQLPAVQQVEIAHRRLGEAYLVARKSEMPAMVSLRAAPAQKAEPSAPAAEQELGAEAAAKSADTAPEKPAGQRTDPRPPAPVTLAGVAGAQTADMSTDPAVAAVISLIDSGDTKAAEAAMAKLTPAQMKKLG